MKSSYQMEQRWLYVSIFANFVYVILFAIGGIKNDSTAVVFDAACSLVYLVSSILITIYSKKINDPATSTFQFGFFKIEPLLIGGQTAIILFSCLFALFNAGRDLVHGHLIKSFLEITILESLTATTSLLISIGCYYTARKYKNTILSVQGLTWLLDFLQSALIALGFSLGILVKGTSYSWIAPYIDPVVMLCLVFTIIRKPIKLFYMTLMELLDVSLNATASKKIEKIIRDVMSQEQASLEIETILKRKAGKKHFIYILYKENPAISLAELTVLKKSLHKEFTKKEIDCFLILGV